MNNRFFDVVVAKEYELKNSGMVTRKTAWNKVGRAWVSKSSEALNFELFLLPNQRYVIQLQDRNSEPPLKPENSSERGEQ